ncbi:hypothetical protein ADK55_17615 [Streptomyces sp. WM4235]|uniref:response regulator transcription factor n=1 Tax=Streptomyces sp. WM4235 TaxID=1415551 RepID=UPI0006C4492B|nr:helix-turn-helix transcriptional regulator [Streptomyces sp. WM4235]KOU52083.1 hypothetical protein ADK55_17615 [Streptomyces sp. WM4235]
MSRDREFWRARLDGAPEPVSFTGSASGPVSGTTVRVSGDLDAADARVLCDAARRLLAHLAQGDTYRMIARRMGPSPHTVDTYLRRLRSKTGAVNRTRLTHLAFQLGYRVGGRTPPPKWPSGRRRRGRLFGGDA